MKKRGEKMTVIKTEDIAGIFGAGIETSDFVYCLEHWGDKDYNLDQILTRQRVEHDAGDKEYFCDTCKKKL